MCKRQHLLCRARQPHMMQRNDFLHGTRKLGVLSYGRLGRCSDTSAARRRSIRVWLHRRRVYIASVFLYPHCSSQLKGCPSLLLHCVFLLCLLA